MSQEKIRQKEFFLSVVPGSYLIGTIKNKKYPRDELKTMLEFISHKKVINLKSSLNNLSHQILIKLFIEYGILKLEETKDLYLQFRDSKNPIFYLYKLKDEIKEDLKSLKTKLNDLFKTVQLDKEHNFIQTEKDFEPKKRDLLYKYEEFTLINKKLLEKNTILEVSFEYLERIDYLSKNYIPKSVYNLKSGFFWFDKNNQLLIIKCQNTAINEAIVSLLGNFFNTKYWKFSLRKEIVDEIFDRKEMIKNSLIASQNTDPNLFNSMVIKDIEFEKKAQNPQFKFIFEYERRSSSYRTDIEGFTNKVKVVIAQYGKISLVGKSIKINRCREWLINLLIEILEIHENFIKNNDISTYMKSSDFIERTTLYEKIKNNEARTKLYELIEKIVVLKENPTVRNIDLIFPMNLGYYFYEFLIPYPNLRCSNDDCNATLLCPNEGCESYKFEIKRDVKKRRYYLKCSKCKAEITEEHNLECIDNHMVNFKLDESIDYILHPSLKIEINQIFKELNLAYEIDNDVELFYIRENKLYRKEELNKFIYKWDELPIFQEIPKIEELTDIVKKAQARRITEILEKCNKRKGECRNCHLNDKKEEICLLRIFSKYSNGQAHPHTGTEFGDFEFPQSFTTGLENIIGIAKSYGKKPSKNQNPQKIYDVDFGLLTFKSNDNLLEQFIQLSMEGTVRFIMVVSGREIDTGLKNALFEIARWKQKKFMIITPKELIPIFSYYFGNLVNQ